MANNTELNTGPFIWGAAQNAAGQPDDTIARTGPDISRETFMDDTFRAFMLLYRSGVWHKGMNADLLDGQHADEFQPICATLTALCALSSYGLVAKTAANTIAARTITASATAGREGIAITNGDGVSGNPEVGLNIGGLTADTTLNSTDEFPYRDATAEGNNKIDASNLAAQLAVLGGYATTATAVTAASAFAAANRVIVADGADRSADDSDFTMTQDGANAIGVASGTGISFGALNLTTTGTAASGAHTVTQATDETVGRTASFAVGSDTFVETEAVYYDSGTGTRTIFSFTPIANGDYEVEVVLIGEVTTAATDLSPAVGDRVHCRLYGSFKVAAGTVTELGADTQVYFKSSASLAATAIALSTPMAATTIQLQAASVDDEVTRWTAYTTIKRLST